MLFIIKMIYESYINLKRVDMPAYLAIYFFFNFLKIN